MSEDFEELVWEWVNAQCQRSTCWSLNVGCVILDVQEGHRVFGSDYVMLAAGGTNRTVHPTMPQCEFRMHKWLNAIDSMGSLTETPEDETENRQRLGMLHRAHESPYEIHAEEEAISNLITSTRTKLGKYIMYISDSPCLNCAKRIVLENSLRKSKFIEEVYYYNVYKRDLRGIQFLESAGIPCRQVTRKEAECSTDNTDCC